MHILPLLGLLACTSGDGLPLPPFEPVPDFALEDVNPTSPSFETLVSPRDRIGQVSVWYFGHAT